MVSDLPNGEGIVGPQPETATGGPVPSPVHRIQHAGAAPRGRGPGSWWPWSDILAEVRFYAKHDALHFIDRIESNQPKGPLMAEATQDTLGHDEIDALALGLANDYYAGLDPNTVSPEVREPVSNISELCDAGYWRTEAHAKLAAPESYVPQDPHAMYDEWAAQRAELLAESQGRYIADLR